MRRLLKILIPLGLVAAIIAWFLSAPSYVDASAFASIEGNAAKGKQVYAVGGCNSCHSADWAKDEAKDILKGGKHFETPFGTFIAPNISPDKAAGIGEWTLIDFANAMQKGVSPKGKHYYPAFPYTSYQRMTNEDVADLFAYMKSLPADTTASQAHEVGFPFNIRRGLGLWKLVFMKSGEIENLETADAAVLRGQYLVEGAGHCGECHTRRNFLGGSEFSNWLAGGPNPDGPGFIPNITAHETGLASWSADEIAEYLNSGFTPEFDVVGGSMVSVVENTALISAEDRAAVAAYLKAIPARVENR